MEIYYAKIFGQGDGVAHSAHIGGFIFGAVAAVAIRRFGWEQKATQSINEKLTWAVDSEITQANNLMETGKLDEAAAMLTSYVAAKPDSFGGWDLLRLIQWRRNDLVACRESTRRVCELNLKAGLPGPAWQDYEEFLNLGGDIMPAAGWLELCRYAEGQGDFQRTVDEFASSNSSRDTHRTGITSPDKSNRRDRCPRSQTRCVLVSPRIIRAP